MFAMRLALAMRRVGVDEMLAGMTGPQLEEWAAFERVRGPFGDDRADLHAGQIVQVVSNALRGKRSAYRLADCVLRFGEAPGDSSGFVKRGDWRSIQEYAKAVAAGMNAMAARAQQPQETSGGEVDC
jgi:hypothetical protein